MFFSNNLEILLALNDKIRRGLFWQELFRAQLSSQSKGSEFLLWHNCCQFIQTKQS